MRDRPLEGLPGRAWDSATGLVGYFVARGVRLVGDWVPVHQRGGWQEAMDAVREISVPDGVRFEGFVEKKFAYGTDPGDRLGGFEPILEPWMGMFHNPPSIPPVFNWARVSPVDVLSSVEWRSSSRHLVAAFALSEYLADFLRHWLDVPVFVLRHPGVPPVVRFDTSTLLSEEPLRLVHVGWWLRDFAAFRAIRANPRSVRKYELAMDSNWVRRIRSSQLHEAGLDEAEGDITYIARLADEQYDQLLASSVVFMNLIDSSANNAVVECVRASTPLLINRTPGAQEYLGREYPLFYSTIAEAELILADRERVRAANHYLERLDSTGVYEKETFKRALNGALERCE